MRELKGGKRTGQTDLYKDKQGNVYVKPKGGNGLGESTGINLNELPDEGIDFDETAAWDYE